MFDRKELDVIKTVRNDNSCKMNDTRLGKKEKKQHIQVFVRIRPLNGAERTGKSVTVVDIPSNREIVVRERPHDKFTKKFMFDKVFGPESKQLDVYNAVVNPLLAEALGGYNCTVFAYGQTGTGKTFTMEGTANNPSESWQTDNTAGIIPRALSHLFDELQSSEIQEYSVRVSFLELYNEEVFDLLSANDDAAKIRIYDDPTKKGAVIVSGLEEIQIHSKSEVFQILEKGSEKRQTAATLMNAHSSRSHTIFSIMIHMKENTIDGEELLKTGKLNLVDLAGSENIGRSGAVDRRAREAGNINQSLLTLGRVITALVEKTPHIPYRESKLTRLLQESLGGRTRTSIIATISPASINLEETLSTLDYAHRAKNITNRPEINEKLSKKALLQEYTAEIERLKKDLLATRERNGVYLTPESYNQMHSMIEFQMKDIEGKENHIKALEHSMNEKELIFNELKSKNSEQANELLNVKNKLESTVHNLMTTSSSLMVSEQEAEEQKHLVEKHASTENVLLSQVQTVLEIVDTVTSDVQKLHDKIYRKIEIGQRNNYIGQQFKNNIKDKINEIRSDISTHAGHLSQYFTTMKNDIHTQKTLLENDIDDNVRFTSQHLVNSQQTIEAVTNNINGSYSRHQKWLDNEFENITAVVKEECNMLNDIKVNVEQKVQEMVENEITKYLLRINDDVTRKVDDLVESTKELITTNSKASIEKCNRLNGNICEVREEVKSIGRKQNSVMEERVKFAKMLEDLQRCFNEVQIEEEENYSSICSTLSNIDETCEIINNQMLDTCRINRQKECDLQKVLESDLQVVKEVIAERTQEARLLAENAILQGRMSISQFQEDLNKNCDTLINYKNCVERNIRQMQKQKEEDKNSVLSAITDIYTKIYNACGESERGLNDYKAAFSNASMKMNKELEDLNTISANVNSRISIETQTLLNFADKFFTEDLFRDVPTGSTPVRKNFQYSKKLSRTSPHERILKRYRETLEDIAQMEDESLPLINDNTSTKEAVNVS